MEAIHPLIHEGARKDTKKRREGSYSSFLRVASCPFVDALLYDQFVDHVPRHIRQAEVSALELEGELQVVEAEEMQD